MAKDWAAMCDRYQSGNLACTTNVKDIEDNEIITLFKIDRTVDFGTIRLESWPEGLVLWVGGEIVYRSWKK